MHLLHGQHAGGGLVRRDKRRIVDCLPNANSFKQASSLVETMLACEQFRHVEKAKAGFVSDTKPSTLHWTEPPAGVEALPASCSSIPYAAQCPRSALHLYEAIILASPLLGHHLCAGLDCGDRRARHVAAEGIRARGALVLGQHAPVILSAGISTTPVKAPAGDHGRLL